MKFLTVRFGFLALLLSAISGLACAPLYADDSTENARQELIRVIEDHVRLTSLELNKTELDRRVMDAMARVPP